MTNPIDTNDTNMLAAKVSLQNTLLAPIAAAFNNLSVHDRGMIPEGKSRILELVTSSSVLSSEVLCDETKDVSALILHYEMFKELAFIYDAAAARLVHSFIDEYFGDKLIVPLKDFYLIRDGDSLQVEIDIDHLIKFE